jgi:hypothetical protein
MRVLKSSAALLTMTLLSTSLFAAEVTGKWTGPMQSGGNAVFDLKSDKRCCDRQHDWV